MAKQRIPYIDVTAEPTLMLKIENFINTLGAVSRDQILRYFRVHHKDTINWCLERLIANPKINYSEREKKFFSHTPTIRTKQAADDLDKAIWILAEMGDTEVEDFTVLPFPHSLLIITVDNSVYDVTVFTAFTAANISTKKAVIPFYVKLNTPGLDDPDAPAKFVEMPDIINHIALVPTRSLGEKLRGSYFDSFCTLNSQTHTPEYHSWNPKV